MPYQPAPNDGGFKTEPMDTVHSDGESPPMSKMSHGAAHGTPNHGTPNHGTPNHGTPNHGHVNNTIMIANDIQHVNDIQPVNMEVQERIKLDRKRERNRVAATKCRHRKLEKIETLEQTVKNLQDQNSNLKQERNNLSAELDALKNEIQQQNAPALNEQMRHILQQCDTIHHTNNINNTL
jgi:ABC-type phosphate transport system auxiliary subunit